MRPAIGRQTLRTPNRRTGRPTRFNGRMWLKGRIEGSEGQVEDFAAWVHSFPAPSAREVRHKYSIL
ncbi:MAG: hypothetical protein D6725_12960 [Planctomycetota bacterium]|nr:MAG: hypothetical protein D6725_12960 [Planctomycetota bacterium]